jgi:hypothetical protein
MNEFSGDFLRKGFDKLDRDPWSLLGLWLRMEEKGQR